MPDIRLSYSPGIDVELTDTAARGGWSYSNLVRWREGCVEKVRGWKRITSTVLAGICRTLHFWFDLTTIPYLAAGTNSNLYIVNPANSPMGAVADITPSGLAPGNPSSDPASLFSLRVWSLDNFGQNLLAVPSGGTLYVWIPPDTTTPAVVVATAPPYNQGGFVTMPQRIVMMFGSSPDHGTLDPLLVRWCAQDDYTDWTALTTNQAGSFRLSRGSRIIGALQSSTSSLLWTDLDLWMAQYEGFPLVFGFFQIGSNCGLIGQNARAILGSVPYWMSDHGFFRATGSGVEQIPCPVWDKVFLDIDEQNWDKCIAGADYHYSTIYFFYPRKSTRSGEIDAYVSYNVAENLWDYGTALLADTAWTDQNRPGNPISIDASGIPHQHDVGYDADDEPMVGVMIRSAFNDLEDGSVSVFVERYFPDMKWESNPGVTPSAELTFYVRDYEGGPVTQSGPHTITPSTEYVIIDLQGREWSEQLSTDAAGVWWRRGVPRARISPDGRL